MQNVPSIALICPDTDPYPSLHLAVGHQSGGRFVYGPCATGPRVTIWRVPGPSSIKGSVKEQKGAPLDVSHLGCRPKGLLGSPWAP